MLRKEKRTKSIVKDEDMIQISLINVDRLATSWSLYELKVCLEFGTITMIAKYIVCSSACSSLTASFVPSLRSWKHTQSFPWWPLDCSNNECCWWRWGLPTCSRVQQQVVDMLITTKWVWTNNELRLQSIGVLLSSHHQSNLNRWQA